MLRLGSQSSNSAHRLGTRITAWRELHARAHDSRSCSTRALRRGGRRGAGDTAREQPGYRGFLLLTDRDQQQLVGISCWETEADVQTSGGGSGYYQQRIADFVGLLVSPPTTTTYEVVVREP